MIELKNLQFSYVKGKPVLKGVNLNWDEAKIHGLMGSNGSGKSTLFYCIKGIRNNFEGEILIDNKILKKQEIAFLPAENYFYPRMKASEYLHFFKISNQDFEPLKWCELMDIPINGLVDSFSTGMKKKLAILGCLALDKKILLLDEPFNGLDAESFLLVQELIQLENQKGKTIILSSHISSSLRDICADIAYLEQGKIREIFKATEYNKMDNLIFDAKRKDLRKKMGRL